MAIARGRIDARAFNELNNKTKYIWYQMNTSPAGETGIHLAGGNSSTFSYTTPSTWGFNTHINNGGIRLRYNQINLTELTSGRLTFYTPIVNSSGAISGSVLSMELTKSSLAFYKPRTTSTGSDTKMMELTNSNLIFYNLNGKKGMDLTSNALNFYDPSSVATPLTPVVNVSKDGLKVFDGKGVNVNNLYAHFGEFVQTSNEESFINTIGKGEDNVLQIVLSKTSDNNGTALDGVMNFISGGQGLGNILWTDNTTTPKFAIQGPDYTTGTGEIGFGHASGNKMYLHVYQSATPNDIDQGVSITDNSVSLYTGAGGGFPNINSEITLNRQALDTYFRARALLKISTLNFNLNNSESNVLNVNYYNTSTKTSTEILKLSNTGTLYLMGHDSPIGHNDSINSKDLSATRSLSAPSSTDNMTWVYTDPTSYPNLGVEYTLNAGVYVVVAKGRWRDITNNSLYGIGIGVQAGGTGSWDVRNNSINQQRLTGAVHMSTCGILPITQNGTKIRVAMGRIAAGTIQGLYLSYVRIR